MDWPPVLLALIGAVGGGGVVAIVQAIANRQKVKAEVHKLDHEAHELAARAEDILIENYKDRLAILDKKVTDLECKDSQQATKIGELKEEIQTLRDDIRSRDLTIQGLEKLKGEQQAQIVQLQNEVKERDGRITQQTQTIEYLASRVTGLEAAVKKLESGTSG